jgi:XTP/dITP diphosphohydrolase
VLIVVATQNRGKIAELAHLLPEAVCLQALSDVGLSPPDETGVSFEDNALIKAHAVVHRGYYALADDSGLEVDALGGRPGVHSARFAGLHATDAANNDLLLHLLANVPDSDRGCRFVSVVVFMTPEGETYVARGEVQGRVLREPRGTNGFGYDPLFEITDAGAAEFNGRTMAELSVQEKNNISHRARAYRKVAPEIERAVRQRGASESASPGCDRLTP